MSLLEYYRAFSCPDEGFDADFLHLVAAEHAREIMRRFLERHGEALATAGSGMVDLFETWMRRDIPFDHAWSLALGLVEATLAPNYDQDPLPVAAGLALAITRDANGDGHVVEWSSHFEKPARLRVGDRLLPAADRIEVEGRNEDRPVRLSCAGKRVARGKTDPALSMDGDPLPSFAVGDGRIVLLPRSALIGFDIQRFPAPPLERVEETLLEPCRAAVALLAEAVPEYHLWVRRVLKAFVPLAGGPGTLVSGSTAQYYGTTYLCLRAEAAAIGEMLIHEGSHQYYHILTWLGPVDDGSDSTLHYSPVKRKGRPIAYILLAYHAFANVMLYYRRCRSRGIDADAESYCAENEIRLLPQLEELEAPLRSSTALTPLGASLWEPLARALRESADG